MFKPRRRFSSVVELTPEALRALGVRALLLDIDNTLAFHDNPEPLPGVLEWLEGLKTEGFALVIVSNNHAPRVRPFAERLGLPFVAEGKKPLPVGFRRACRLLGVPPGAAAVVGDQIFTDILGGNLLGAPTFLVEPAEPEAHWFFRLKRWGERKVLRDPAFAAKKRG